jgi:glycosyltransferase involved in cell wall biosynthesis
MDSQTKDAIAKQKFDLVIASQYNMGAYASSFKGIPAILDEIELGSLHQTLSQSILNPNQFRRYLTWTKHRKYISNLVGNYRICTVASAPEKELLSRLAPKSVQIRIIPNCVNLAEYSVYSQESYSPKINSMIFTGSLQYYPNYEAMIWFLNKVFPKIQSVLPDTTLNITGDVAGKQVPQIRNVNYCGYQDNIYPLVARSWMSIVPILQGGGTRLKILEAMAIGTPVISTTKGAEGLDVVSGRDILIADTCEEFFDAVIRLFRHPQLREMISRNARQTIAEKYDWLKIMPDYIHMVNTIV